MCLRLKFVCSNHVLLCLGNCVLSVCVSFWHCAVALEAVPAGSMLLDPGALRDAIQQYSQRPRTAVAALDALLRSHESGADSSAATSFPINLQLKHLNIMDPLLPTNNLGRSVSKASFSRIRTALSYGATTLNKLLSLDPLAASEGIASYFKNTWRSPTRMAADNQVFQNRLAMGGAALLSRASLAGGFGLPVTGATLPGAIGPGMVRRHSSSLSLPEISSERSQFDDGEGGDSLEVHDGRSTSPVQRVKERSPARPMPSPPAPGPRVEHGRSMSDIGALWHNVSQPVSPMLSPRTGGTKAPAESPNGIRPEVVTMSLARENDDDGEMTTLNGDDTDDSSERSTPRVLLQQASLPPAPQDAPLPPTPVQSMRGRDIFIADMDTLVHNLHIARMCYWSGEPAGEEENVHASVAQGGGGTLRGKVNGVAKEGQTSGVPPEHDTQHADNSKTGSPSAPGAAPPDDGLSAAMASLPSLRVMPAPLEPGSYASVTVQGLTPTGASPAMSSKAYSTVASAASSAAGSPTLVRLGMVISPRKSLGPTAPQQGQPTPKGTAAAAPPAGPPRNPWKREIVAPPGPASQGSSAASSPRAALGPPPPVGHADGSEPAEKSQATWSAVAGRPPSRLGPTSRPSAAPASGTAMAMLSGDDPLPPSGRVGSVHLSAEGGDSAQSTPSASPWGSTNSFAAVVGGKKAASLKSGASTPAAGASPRVGTWAAAAASSPKAVDRAHQAAQAALRPRPNASPPAAAAAGPLPAGPAAVEPPKPLLKDISFKLEHDEFPSLSAASES